jgi:hypothetical protein
MLRISRKILHESLVGVYMATELTRFLGIADSRVAVPAASPIPPPHHACGYPKTGGTKMTTSTVVEPTPAMTASRPRSWSSLSHSQVELAEIETYERAHQDRVPSTAPLAAPRGAPAGYDAMSTERLVAALERRTSHRSSGYAAMNANRRPPRSPDEVTHREHGYRSSSRRQAPDRPAVLAEKNLEQIADSPLLRFPGSG